MEFRVLVRGDATPADGAHHGPRAVPVLHRQPAEHDDREDDGVDVELPGVGALARPLQEGESDGVDQEDERVREREREGDHQPGGDRDPDSEPLLLIDASEPIERRDGPKGGGDGGPHCVFDCRVRPPIA